MKKTCLLIVLSFGVIFGLMFGFGCAHPVPKYKTALEYSKSKQFTPGRLVIIQGPTSATEANINILSPVLKKYIYVVKDDEGKTYDVENYETVHTAPLHWKVDKIYVKGLAPNKRYSLEVMDEFRSSRTQVDQRYFSALDTSKNSLKFAYASCMADDYRFNDVIDPMWARMEKLNPELIILNGDIVYVDSFDFVERKKATELDIWFRFIDSFNRLPLYNWRTLKPILATWDDHDFGTNDGDRDFSAKVAARKIFLAFFGGKNLKDVYQLETDSVYFSFTGFKQKMLFIDDRYFRQPNKEQKVSEKYGHWGEKQHNWMLSNLNDSNTPVWIFNGNQVFSGKDLAFKESMQTNHPEHFGVFLEDLKIAKSPVIFGSGDVHFSEIMQIPASRIGYETFEVTSSSMHSYTGEGWDNSLRIQGAFTNEFNFMMINSKYENSVLTAEIETWGLAETPYFKKKIELKR